MRTIEIFLLLIGIDLAILTALIWVMFKDVEDIKNRLVSMRELMQYVAKTHRDGRSEIIK